MDGDHFYKVDPINSESPYGVIIRDNRAIIIRTEAEYIRLERVMNDGGEFVWLHLGFSKTGDREKALFDEPTMEKIKDLIASKHTMRYIAERASTTEYYISLIKSGTYSGHFIKKWE